MNISLLISIGFLILFISSVSFLWYMCRTSSCCSFYYDNGNPENASQSMGNPIYYIGAQHAFGLPCVFDSLPNHYAYNVRSRQRQDSRQRLNSDTSLEEYDEDVSPAPSPGPPSYETLEIIPEEKPPPQYEDIITDGYI